MKEIVILLFLPFLTLACAGGAIQKPLTPGEKKTVADLMTAVAEINRRTPETLSASMEITGAKSGKKYKSAGEISFDAKAGRLNLVLFDFIFKAPYTMLFKTGDSLSLYYPLEKKLILTTTQKIEPGFVAGLSVDIKTLVDLTSGKIPLIPDYRARQMADSGNPRRALLLLENRDCYETISFIDGRPDRILFVRKESKEKIEVYMKKYHSEGGVQYYRNLRIISESQSMDVEIAFTRISMNKPLKMKTEKDISLPRDVNIVKQ